MSALGQKRTLKSVHPMSAISSKADMVQRYRDVRYVLNDLAAVRTAINIVTERDYSGRGFAVLCDARKSHLEKIEATVQVSDGVGFAHRL
jgi:hypothetical protein